MFHQTQQHLKAGQRMTCNKCHIINERKKDEVIMGKLEKDAAREFSKLSKKEQQRINKLKRIPVPRPAQLHDKKDVPRKKKWDESGEE